MNQETSEMGDIGWKRPAYARKWHFFAGDGRSLCGGWMTLGNSGEMGDDDSPGNCAKCRRVLKQRHEHTPGKE